MKRKPKTQDEDHLVQVVLTLRVPSLSPEHAAHIVEQVFIPDCLFAEVDSCKIKPLTEPMTRAQASDNRVRRGFRQA